MEKPKKKEIPLWMLAERILARRFDAEAARKSGLSSADSKRWNSALVRLSEAAAHGCIDVQTLDALGEAAYRTRTLEALLPFAPHYTHPQIATHFVRTLIGCRAIEEAERWLTFATPSLLKSALGELLKVKGTIDEALSAVDLNIENLRERRLLDFPEYWQAIAALAPTAERDDVRVMAEERAKALDFGNPLHHLNQAYGALLRGELRAGWRLFDRRLQSKSGLKIRTDLLPCPMWQGEDLKDKKILVAVDYGLGDQIFGLRFIQPLVEAGAKVEIAVRRELFDWVAISFQNLKVHQVASLDQPLQLEGFDYWSYALSIPYRAGIANEPGKEGYLRKPRFLTGDAAKQIANENPQSLPVLGINWHGDISTPTIRTRAFTVEEFYRAAKLDAQPAVWLVLQKDVTSDELNWLYEKAKETGSIVLNAAPLLKNFLYTAAWISTTRELITCDTSVAHAGGALGHPTRVLIRNKSIWAWREGENNRAAWYDSATIEFTDADKPAYLFEMLPTSGPKVNELSYPNDRESLRAAAAAALKDRRWPAALLWLSHLAKNGQRDPETLEALAEAAYRTTSPEILGPVQNYYKYPPLAAQMARGFMMMGDVKSAQEFLGYSSDNGLKKAIEAIIDMEENPISEKILKVAREYPHLDYSEFWRSAAAVADAAKEPQLQLFCEARAQATGYDDPNIHFNQALRLMSLKQWTAAWTQYEYRLVPGVKDPPRAMMRYLPIWEGESLSKKTLLVFLEQGLGDEILAMRFVRRMREEGVDVQVSAQKPMVDLIQTSYPDMVVYEHEELTRPEEEKFQFKAAKPDYWVYSMSIPVRAGWFEPKQELAYLKASDSKRKQVRDKIKQLNPEGLPVYVINWHGRIDTPADRTRAYTSTEFIEITDLLSSPCFIISVQKGAEKEQLLALKSKITEAGCRFADVCEELHDLHDTAAWIMESERLFTCDTSISHLGGALGHPTSVLVRNTAIWQWVPAETIAENLHRAVWYDSVTIQHALVPKRSWMFSNSTKAKEKLDERDFDDIDSGLDIQSGNAVTYPQRRKIRFAGLKADANPG